MTKDQTPSREEVIRWAREAGFKSPDLYKLTVGHASIETLERLAQAAYAAGAYSSRNRQDTLSNTPNLKPCPFCGGMATAKPIDSVPGWYHVTVLHSDCFYKPEHDQMLLNDEHLAAWNRRTPQPAPAPLSDDTKRLAWMADEWTPGHEKLYDKHVLETGGVGGLDDLRTFIDKQIAAQEGKT